MFKLPIFEHFLHVGKFQAKIQVVFQTKTQAKCFYWIGPPDAKIAMFCKEYQKGTRSWDRCSTFALKKIKEDAAKQSTTATTTTSTTTTTTTTTTSTTTTVTAEEEALQEEVRERLQEVRE